MDDEKTVSLSVALEAARKARRYRNALSELFAELTERGLLSEGQMAAITGLDRVSVRELIDDASIEGPRLPDEGGDLFAVRAAYGKTQDLLRSIFADGVEHSNAEVMRALGISTAAVAQTLRRSSVVTRVRRGWWKLAEAVDG